MSFVKWKKDTILADFHPGDMAILNWLMRPEGTLEELADVLEADKAAVSQRSKQIKALLHKTVKGKKNAPVMHGRLLEPIFRAMDAKIHTYVKTQHKDKDTRNVNRTVEHFEAEDHDTQLKAMTLLRGFLGPAMDKIAAKEVAEQYQIEEADLATMPNAPQLPGGEPAFLDDLNQTFQARSPEEAVAVTKGGA